MAHILAPKVAYRIKDDNDPDGNLEYHCRVMSDDHGVLFSCGLLRTREELTSEMIRDVDPKTLCQHCFGPYLVRDTEEAPLVDRRQSTAAPEDPENKGRRLDDDDPWKVQAKQKKKRKIAGAISLLAICGITWLLVNNSGVRFGQEISTTVKPPVQQEVTTNEPSGMQQMPATDLIPVAATQETADAKAQELEEQKAAAEKKQQEELAAEKMRQEELAAEKKKQEALAAKKKKKEALAAEKKKQDELAAAEKKKQEALAAEKKKQDELAAAENKKQEELAAEQKKQEELAAAKKRPSNIKTVSAQASAPAPAAATAPATDTAPGSAFPPIGFSDPMLELCIREALAIGPKAPITQELALSLVELDCSDTGIEKLEGLDQLPYLQKLDLSSNVITDMSPVVDLKNLLKLNLKKNQITDIAVVAKIPAKCDINLLLNPIKDITPFIIRSKQ